MLAHRPGHSPAMLHAALLQYTLHYVVPEGVASKGGLVLKDRSDEVRCERRWAPFNQVLQDTAAIGMPGEVCGCHRGLREEQGQDGGPAVLADTMCDVVPVLVIQQILKVALELRYHRETNLVIANLHEPLNHTTCMHIRSQLQPFTPQHIDQRPLMILAGPLQHSNQRILAMPVPRKLRGLAQHHVEHPSVARRYCTLNPTSRTVLSGLLKHRPGAVYSLLAGVRRPRAGERCGNAGQGL
mmetsp:Transcript_92931/g.212653  ORF Transcript_92931/g.212653 Transcript_92931/m.212653 type:complete len:241 (-) Transcript_92931:527-1249(-)